MLLIKTSGRFVFFVVVVASDVAVVLCASLPLFLFLSLPPPRIASSVATAQKFHFRISLSFSLAQSTAKQIRYHFWNGTARMKYQ